MDSLNFLIRIFNLLFLIKIGALILIVVYLLFAFVVLNQIRTMNKIVFIPSSSKILILVGTVHIVLAISLFLLALVIL